MIYCFSEFLFVLLLVFLGYIHAAAFGYGVSWVEYKMASVICLAGVPAMTQDPFILLHMV